MSLKATKMWHWWFAWRPITVAGHRVFWQHVSRRWDGSKWCYGIGATGKPILKEIPS